MRAVLGYCAVEESTQRRLVLVRGFPFIFSGPGQMMCATILHGQGKPAVEERGRSQGRVWYSGRWKQRRLCCFWFFFFFFINFAFALVWELAAVCYVPFLPWLSAWLRSEAGLGARWCGGMVLCEFGLC